MQLDPTIEATEAALADAVRAGGLCDRLGVQRPATSAGIIETSGLRLAAAKANDDAHRPGFLREAFALAEQGRRECLIEVLKALRQEWDVHKASMGERDARLHFRSMWALIQKLTALEAGGVAWKPSLAELDASIDREIESAFEMSRTVASVNSKAKKGWMGGLIAFVGAGLFGVLATVIFEDPIRGAWESAQSTFCGSTHWCSVPQGKPTAAELGGVERDEPNSDAGDTQQAGERERVRTDDTDDSALKP